MENEVSVVCIHKEYDEQKEIALKGYKAYQKIYYVPSAIIASIIFGCYVIVWFIIFFFYASDGSRELVLLNGASTSMFSSLLFFSWLRIKEDYKKFEKILLSEENRKVSFEIGNGYLKMTNAAYYLTGKRTGHETEAGIINLKDDVCKVIRTTHLYSIVLPNKLFNVIPLNIFTAEEIQQIDGMFSTALGRKYKVLKDKKKV